MIRVAKGMYYLSHAGHQLKHMQYAYWIEYAHPAYSAGLDL